MLTITRDPRAAAARASDAARDLPPGTRYVLCVLRPSRDLSLDADDLALTLRSLTHDATSVLPPGDYAAIAGVAGSAPQLVTASSLPFRREIALDGVNTEIRMESWLASDTIRRMGFGHVIARHQHTLIVERGVSLVAFDGEGRAIQTAYASNIFARQARYLVEFRRP